MKQLWSADDMPDQHGRVAVVTGANTGLGFEIASALAARGAAVVLAVRDTGKGRQAADRINGLGPDAEVTVQRLDLSSLESVGSAADELRATHPKIDLLINNAGVMYTPRTTTIDGYELQFATNHLGHFAFTGLLLPHMLPVPGSRVVTVSSISHKQRARIDFDDLHAQKSYDRVAAYGRSKLANLLFTYELQRRLAANHADTLAVASHPGVAESDLSRNVAPWMRPLFAAAGPFIRQSAAMGALPTLRAATDPEVVGGQYYGPGGLGGFKGHPAPVTSSAESYDAALQRRLWTVSEELTGVEFPLHGGTAERKQP
ncbi:SDR family NAD(P)-dependent oxidoreductase [Streptomyces sp. Li-HN-5-11]|uniref:SDR family NAD(P)-dependent oxidoreductase n=1 Tax=Streptomyces sp. Li-HN-5-11 TaxID=3075432 RepID=UPI0028A7D639|nr:SDR family NAD(P)-dependent oxidoreductase [Streptomyces sp. Li-HN-5-11]WNM34780.1 SDR family NAD(P)-dependent oxidoreductase [Streptomyces sp. Li-HN-5-11]